MYPTVVALATEQCIFSGHVNKNTWGKGHGAYAKIEDNIHRVNDHVVRDRTNAKHECKLFPDIPRIVSDILKNGAKLAIVSRNTSKAMIDRTLYYFMVKDQHGNDRRLIELVSYDEVYDKHKTVHFKAIHGYHNEQYADMVLYDRMKRSTRVEMMLGVTFQYCPQGLNWSVYQEGLATWRRTKNLHSPWHGRQLTAYPKRKLIGYSGMDLDTIELLEKGGRRHDRKEAARWGYAMYVTDDPRVAKYFSDWIKVTAFGPQATTIVCEIYARDGDKWDQMNKIWVPDSRHDLKTHVDKDEATVADSELKRDAQVAAWGVHRPYVLFSRHPNMKKRDGLQFPIRDPLRFNELVIYGQTQENLIVVNRMSDAQLNQAIKNKVNVGYEHKIPQWKIQVPEETKADFRKHNEHPTLS
ncbi:Magnesium-dependent phosphatase 1 [Steccherinum ochraceum]|uniref:Magnesium-dependent phosphatase 1 n=1 Tax=Steccherinum ochraceum TaxID=92696 RepID=A0A4R0RSG8_9APHY|nr:Magnesium-dependent phosphatase 1 [Steccherinum ochraceum]